MEADYNSGAPGVNYADIIDMRELLADVNSDEDWYIAGIALATADATMKGVNLVQQELAGVTTAAVYGFNAGIQLNIDASNTKSELEQTSSLASTLSGNNINILTGLAQGGDRGAVSTALGMTIIQGSHLNAKNAINISTGELSVLASRDTSSSSETQNGHITIAQTIGGAASGPTVSASYDRNQTKDKTTTYNNATLTAADINIITAGDTRIEGANLSADNRLNLDVGGDLLLESKQNRASGSNKGFGVSGGFSLGGKDEPGIKGLNGGFNTSNGRYQNKETVLSSITGAEVKVNVAGNTNIVGALLASLNSEGKDNGQLSLTTGSLSFTDLSNTGFNSQQSMGLTTSVGVSRTGISGGSSTFTYSNESSYDKSKTLATIGQGTVTVGDAGAADSAATTTAALAGLNRDSSNLTKEFYSVDRQQGNIDLTVDHRLLSEEGRKQIGEDFKRTELLAGSIADIATEESVTIGDTFQHIGDVQKDLDVQKLMATQDGGENALILNDLANATPEQKQQALDAYAVAYAEIYDISIDEAKVITNKQYRGASFTEDGSSRIYVSDSEQDNALDYAETIGHEVAHVQIEQGAIRDRGDLNEDYAKLRGTYAAQNYDFNFSHNNLGIVNTGNTNNHVGNNSSELIRRNNKSFSGEDSTQGEFYLSKGQQAVYDNALTACDGNVVCQATTEAKYVYISAKQDVALNTGVVEGVGKEVVDEVLGLIDVLKDPGQVVDSFKAILEDPTILASVAESEVDEVKKLIADFEIQYEAAEWDGANLAGEDLGRLTAKVVGLIGGVTAAAKVTKSVVTKVGGQLDTVALQGTTNKAEIIVEPSRLLEYKVDKNALFTSDRVSVVVDEKSFIEYYVDKDFEGNTIYDINGSFVLKNEISIPPGKYMTFTEDVAGKGIAETRSILSINGKTTKTQVGYEMYDGQNYRIDFDIVGQLNKLNIPAFNSNYLNDIGGPAAFGGGRQRVNNEPMIISPSLNPIFHRFDGISIPKYNNLSRDAKVKLKGSEYVK
ncbi:hemagglutinin repeat-containing protein [Shewanella sp.]|uniref:hemagglutinin repeat-containing protein n=1 Tax=Shewanella sp. TaxID=50422 RepID=UPI004053C01A